MPKTGSRATFLWAAAILLLLLQALLAPAHWHTGSSASHCDFCAASAAFDTTAPPTVPTAWLVETVRLEPLSVPLPTSTVHSTAVRGPPAA